MQFIPTRIHGALDYIVGLVLIASPWIFDFADEGAAMWIPIIVGVSVLAMSLLTDYELGAVRVIPMSAHLAADIVAGIFLAASPWLFAFSDEVWIPHLIFGLIAIGTGALTSRRPSDVPRTRATDRPGG